mgnify:FL=1
MGKQNKTINTVKVREDDTPIRFLASEAPERFTFETEQQLDWCQDSTFSKHELRTRIEPWLTSLFQSEHLSLLVGSGLTSAVQYAACGKSDNGMGADAHFTVFADEIKQAADRMAKDAHRGPANIEDQIRAANELVRGLDIIKDGAKFQRLRSQLIQLQEELSAVIEKFTSGVSQGEYLIASADQKKREEAFHQLILFLMSFASRTGTRDRLHIFTTNYDRLIEAGADLAGLRLIDRFVGALSPIFRSSRMDVDMHYNPPGIRGEPRYLEGVARFTKLHGSLDWLNIEDDIRRIGLPFGAKTLAPFLEAEGLGGAYPRLMIYPNSTKDRETAEYPYVELFRDFAAALCRPNSTLVTYGYSFGDDHINRVIRDMLTIPSTHLVIISYDDSSGRILEKYNGWGRNSQISLLIGKDVADLGELVYYYLPKPAIDRATMRMAEILRQRFSQPRDNKIEGE